MDVRYNATTNFEGVTDIIEAQFLTRMLDERHPFLKQEAWATEQEERTAGWHDKLPDASEWLGAVDSTNFTARLFERDGSLVFLRYYPKSQRVTVALAGTAMDALDAIVVWVKTMLPELEDTDEADSIAVRFWSGGMTGPQSFSRRITAPTMDEVAGNYSAEVQKELSRMASPDFKPGDGGQLLLWYGPPGTGKTYALRALSQAWREWAEIHYIVDPERFFGDANYLMPVMLARPDSDKTWRLIVLEDTGELLSSDAKERAGQGLSRLLNVVDGFLGQGLNTLVLITTNEKLERLHPAVSRPGRCAVKVNFDALDAPTARKWAEANGIAIEDRSHSLAELFAIRAGTRHDESDKPAPTKRRPIGFRAAKVSAPTAEEDAA